MNKKRDTTNSIDLSKFEQKVISDLPDDITWEYLVQLWRVIKKGKGIPISEMQIRADDDTTPYPTINLSVNQAKINFARAAKIYVQKDPLKDVIDAARRDGEVVISNTFVQSTVKTYHLTQGYVEPLLSCDAVIRQLSDIITTYTAYNAKERNFICTFDRKICKALKIPYLNLIHIRAALGVTNPDYYSARGEIFSSLKHGLPFFWFACLQDILNADDMIPFRAEASKSVVTWYTNATALYPKYRKDVYYVFKPSTISLYTTSLEETWKFAIGSDMMRGSNKRKGVFSLGYYSFSVGPTYVRLGEARDILSVMSARSLKVIELAVINHELAAILAYNGMMVICYGMSDEEKNEFSQGIYGKTKLVSLLYRELPVSPMRDRDTIKFSNEPNFQGVELRSLYLSPSLPVCMLYPSVRVSQGVVMGFYDPMTCSKPSDRLKTIFIETKTQMVRRFCHGVTWRNNYLFTKVPFFVKDSYRDHFINIRLPRLKKEQEGIVFSNETVANLGDQITELEIPSDYGKLQKYVVPVKKIEEEELTEEMINAVRESSGTDDAYIAHYVLHAAITGNASRLVPQALKTHALMRYSIVKRVLYKLDAFLVKRDDHLDHLCYSFTEHGREPPTDISFYDKWVPCPELEGDDVDDGIESSSHDSEHDTDCDNNSEGEDVQDERDRPEGYVNLIGSESEKADELDQEDNFPAPRRRARDKKRQGKVQTQSDFSDLNFEEETDL